MNPVETGKAIASLRKEAGMTQAALAKALEVSDKAVSKWERGIACPDISLLPKLSVLLDTDIDSLFSGEHIIRGSRWKGILVLDKYTDAQIYSKPLVYLLLQNFLLVGIRDILIIGGNAEVLLGNGEQFGVSFTFSSQPLGVALSLHRQFITANAMIVYGNSLIHGANLTRRYQGMMFHMNEAVVMKTDSGKQVPLIFCPERVWRRAENKIPSWKKPEDMIRDIEPVERSFARGILALPMNDKDQILTASRFVQIVEKCEEREMANLEEISRSRGLL